MYEIIRAIVRDELDARGFLCADPIDELASEAVANYYDAFETGIAFGRDDGQNLLHALITDVAEEAVAICPCC